MVIHRFLGLLGGNITHSLSPFIHNTWIDFYGLFAHYSLLPSYYSLEDMRERGILGANITMPFKKKWVKEVVILNASAQKSRALNTVWYDHGTWYGHNTDIMAFENLVPVGECAVVFGSGGAAMASIVALQNLGYRDIHVVSRSAWDHSEFICHLHDLASSPWQEIVKKADTVVNAFPLPNWGEKITRMMRDQSVFVDWVYEIQGQNSFVYASHVQIIKGRDLLIEQARYSFEIWFGILPDSRIITNKLQGVW